MYFKLTQCAKFVTQFVGFIGFIGKQSLLIEIENLEFIFFKR